VSVVVPVHNGADAFGRCVEALAALDPAPHEVIVVADGATDASPAAARRHGFDVIQLPEAGGPAAARNIGARRATGEVLLFLDADVMAPADTAGRVARLFAGDAELTAAFGSYDDEPVERNFLSQYKNLLHHYVHQTSREEASTFWAGCGAIRRRAFLAAGGFDEGYRCPCVEDIELGYRLRRAGARLRLVKSLQVKHLKAWRTGSLLRADFFGRALPWTGLILRERRMDRDLNLRRSARASVVMAWAMPAAMVAAVWWPWGLAVAAALALGLLAANWKTYAFLRRKRGLWFAVRSVPWHWLYYLYSGLAFAIAVAAHLLRPRRRRRAAREGPADG
jgi:GT2 family glycosyltransferase